MVVARFSYKDYTYSGGRICSKPIGYITITNGGHSLSPTFIIDTGADKTTINYDIGKNLGFAEPTPEEKQNAPTLTCASGKPMGFLQKNVRLKVGTAPDFPFKIAWCFDSPGENIMGLDLHDQFKFLFDKENKTILLTKHTKPAFNSEEVLKKYRQLKTPPRPKRSVFHKLFSSKR